jgi:hypothetical protein
MFTRTAAHTINPTSILRPVVVGPPVDPGIARGLRTANAVGSSAASSSARPLDEMNAPSRIDVDTQMDP